LLDTHAWLWWIGRDARLGRKAFEHLDALGPSDRPWLSAISLWEAAMLIERRRILIDGPLIEWFDAACHPRTIQVLPITPAIAADTAALPAAFHRDPADRLIVATSRVHALPLLTRDKRILRARLVTRWRPS
jgi:PIN domain nuclease of toxin-antitoxin system